MPAQPIADTLLNIGLQYRVTLGGDLTACRGTAPALRGTMTLEMALTRTLRGSGCSFNFGNNGAVSIRRNPVSRPVAPLPSTAPALPVAITTMETAEPVSLGDVVVTAERRPNSPQRVPLSITAVGGQLLTMSGAVDTNALGGLVAGMTMTNLGSGRNKVLLRGMSDGAFTGLTQSTVGLYLDHIPLTYSAPDPNLRLIDIDRVEVLRGPQGAMYGTGSIGGVVRLLSRSPDTISSSLDLSAARALTRHVPSTDFTAVGNLPLGDGAGAIRLAAYEERTGGYVDDVSLNLRRVNAGSRHGGRLAASIRLAPEWIATAGLVHQSINAEDTHYVFRRLGGLRRANLVREPHSNDFDLVHANIAGHGDWGRLEASVARIDHDFVSRYDASESLQGFGSRSRIGVLDDAKDIDLLFGDAIWTSPTGRPLRWTVGASVSRGETVSGTDLKSLWPIRTGVYGETRQDRSSELALFGEASYDLRPDLTLIVGGRLSRIGLKTVSLVSHRGQVRDFEGHREVWRASPKLALDYRLHERTNLYVQLTHGRRTGGFNTAGPIELDFEGGAGRPARHFTGDSLLNFEAGAKARLLEDRLQARLAVFLADWDQIQSDQFLPSGLAYAVNVGDGANHGAELEVSWQAGQTLVLRANALLARPRLTRVSEDFNSRGDAGLPGVPAASANLHAIWTHRHGRELESFVSGQLSYVGPSRLTFDAERRHRMGDYATGRIDAGLSKGIWMASIFIDNPFNAVANTFAFSDPFRLPQALATTPLRPRTLGLRVGLSL